MALDLVNEHFLDAGSTTAIQRFFVDMPTAPKKTCLIRQVQVTQVELDRARTAYDTRFAMSVDPDHVAASLILRDSTMFLSGSFQGLVATAVGFFMHTTPFTYFYPEGIRCPYTRLPFFVQHSNTNSAVTNWNITVFYEFVSVTAQELAIAILRRGKGETITVP